MPVVSVIVPTHNRPNLLAETLASVRAQTFTDYEIIVVSNGESPEVRCQSLDVAASYDALYFALPDGNLPAARNFGIDQARGEWIAFLDDDDLWIPYKLDRQLAEAQQSGADLITCDYIHFFPDGREITERARFPAGWSWHKSICRRLWHCIPSCALVRANAIAAVSGFDPRQLIYEDHDLWRRMALNGARLHNIEEPLLRYRNGHSSIMDASNMCKRRFYDLRLQFKAYREAPASLRAELASPLQCIVLPALIWCVPDWFLRPHPGLRPRTRMLAAKNWLANWPSEFPRMW
jgi:glycosyltransferase involved in cell wall biosynthesis